MRKVALKEPLLIVGAGGHAHSCADVIEAEGRFEIIGFVDIADIRASTLAYPLLGGDEDLKSLLKLAKFAFLGIGQIKSPENRVRLYEKLKTLGYALPTIISPLAYVSKSAFIEPEASIIMHHALINAGARVGKACIINTKALVEHGARVGDFCHISTAAVVNGDCVVGECSFIASNTALRHTQIVPANSLVYHTTTLVKSALNGGGAN